MPINYRLVATQVGDAIKYATSVNEINRAASAALIGVSRQEFPHESITSERAQTVYDWICSLARTPMDATLRARRLVAFCKGITPGTDLGSLAAILERAGVPPRIIYSERREKFERRKFHSSVVNHARDLFFQGNYFHAVFEAAKAYNKSVREKARSDKEGSSLMMDVWGCRGGVLKITKCSSETDVNVQDGIKFLSVGLMRAIRNPTAHEPATDWPINEEDCLDILSFISFLFRRLDMAEYYAG